MENSSVISVVQKLMQTQNLAVLGTSNGDTPHCSIVNFSATDDLHSIVFATYRDTRKYANLKNNRRVSLLVDNRSNQENDHHQAVAITVFGNARELAFEEKAPFLLHHLIKHPSLVEFTDSPNCALILVEVEKYYVVQQFKIVTELYPTPLDKQ
ncbi:pyridoxamine 5'-phosphate oxidase family protein [Atribacter laminatus]|jgi:nitroimidazol reductase NimA-like FMN-containing flavoprotein (pyridoxamine 5'-phosphate oxidase superfamily)|uniref:Pyridoxamine 5'-phosphate oxidase N-terminal domain-containing protein n=1 Tax=Atribacter laminatus TaxID=2847778 RepID=A0A7T1AKH9_ATRLM|nr:pyridoxamine 5'-phosphate oxidase family protein [Atribacter laminatus]QPM67609.1 hypothetical protein RT761_00813 [Atribacter laminatus]